MWETQQFVICNGMTASREKDSPKAMESGNNYVYDSVIWKRENGVGKQRLFALLRVLNKKKSILFVNALRILRSIKYTFKQEF